MKFRHKTTGELIHARRHDGEGGPVRFPGGEMYLDPGDYLVRRADGSYEGYQRSHPFWADYTPVRIVRLVRVDRGGTRSFRVERLTANGWQVRATGATLAEVRANLAAADDDETETVLETYEDGVKV